ncbi:MAG: type II toxin-antitoxin system antitoxin DNA ADP-ribosyl glycohydrolase DarG [Rhodanobacteraceae bacterium]
MIEYTTGDILNASAEALVNTVNCVGIMGRGIALQFKNTFPANFKAYAQACKRDEVQPGQMFVYETGFLHSPKFIINFPTKRHWRGKSRMEDLEAGLLALVDEIRHRDIRSVAVPPLGSGLGGLEWADVRSRIETALGSLDDVRVIVFEPNGKPDGGKAFRPKAVPKMTAGRAALVVLMNRYLNGLLDPFVSLLEVHKLMYFMQESGEPLRLRYEKGLYGPYAQNLRHVLSDIEGYMVSGYRGEDAPQTQLELVPGAVRDAEALLRNDVSTREHFARVAALVEGFESPFGLELLATVHWVAMHEHVAGPKDAIAHTYAWGERKRRFTERQIGLAFDTLGKGDWLHRVEAATGA